MVAARVARTRVRVNVGDMPYAKGRNGAGPEVSDPVITAHLIRPIGHELVALLRNLDADAWSRATSAPGWTVKDVVAHMLRIKFANPWARRRYRHRSGSGPCSRSRSSRSRTRTAMCGQPKAHASQCTSPAPRAAI